MTLHQANDIIAQRYRIVTPLGTGGMGITYEAEDLKNYQRVALKVVSLQQAKDWKILELFEREAKVIANLNHPQIPKYLNYFYLDTEQDRWFYFIRELVSGNSLANWVEKGWHPTEAEVKQFAIQILEILSYLHQLNPPIIHRDIKPENVILQPDGKIFLVDFGAVQDIYRQTMSFSGTFVGTIGYMPPEHLQGKAYCASDLYSLGGTLLYLLTHRSPDKLPQKRMKIDFRSCVEISPKFVNWLEVILEPMWEDRFQSATAALNVLCNKSHLVKSSIPKPAGSRVTCKKTPRSLIINIPPKGFLESIISLVYYYTPNFITVFLFFGISCALPLIFDNYSIFSNTFVSGFLLLLFIMCVFSLVAIVISFPVKLWSLVSKSKIQIQIDKNEFFIHWKFLVYSRKIRGKTADIYKIGLNYINNEVVDRKIKSCSLFVGVKNYEFGFSLKPVENEWLVAEISDFLQKLKP